MPPLTHDFPLTIDLQNARHFQAIKQYHKKTPLMTERRQKPPYLEDFTVTVLLTGSCSCGKCLLKGFT